MPLQPTTYQTLQVRLIEKSIGGALAQSFISKGHNLTGALIRDMKFITDQSRFHLDMEVWLNEYGAYLDQGVPASRIPFSPGSGAGSSKYIEGLTKYVMLRMGISDMKEAKSVAFSIAHTQKKKGMPAKTGGKGTGWIDEALRANIPGIEALVLRWGRDNLEALFEILLTKYKHQFKR